MTRTGPFEDLRLDSDRRSLSCFVNFRMNWMKKLMALLKSMLIDAQIIVQFIFVYYSFKRKTTFYPEAQRCVPRLQLSAVKSKNFFRTNASSSTQNLNWTIHSTTNRWQNKVLNRIIRTFLSKDMMHMCFLLMDWMKKVCCNS